MNYLMGHQPESPISYFDIIIYMILLILLGLLCAIVLFVILSCFYRCLRRIGFFYKLKILKINKEIKVIKPENDDICIICFDNYNEETKDKCVEIKKCNHTFHKKCIIKWLLIKPTCPLCVIHV